MEWHVQTRDIIGKYFKSVRKTSDHLLSHEFSIYRKLFLEYNSLARLFSLSFHSPQNVTKSSYYYLNVDRPFPPPQAFVLSYTGHAFVHAHSIPF